MNWERITKPLEDSDNSLYRVIKMLRHHVKYCPVDNPNETHIIRKTEFNKLFKQTTS